MKGVEVDGGRGLGERSGGLEPLEPAPLLLGLRAAATPGAGRESAMSAAAPAPPTAAAPARAAMAREGPSSMLQVWTWWSRSLGGGGDGDVSPHLGCQAFSLSARSRARSASLAASLERTREVGQELLDRDVGADEMGVPVRTDGAMVSDGLATAAVTRSDGLVTLTASGGPG